MFRINSDISKSSGSVSNNGGINNILLVGNGFDLALGFKTSYSDFVKFISVKVYLINACNELKKSKEYREFVKNSLQKYFFEKKGDGNKREELNESMILQIYSKAIDEIEDPKNLIFNNAESLNAKLDLSFISDFFKLVLGEELFKVIKGKAYLTSKLQFEHGEEYLNVKNTFKKKFDNKQISNRFGQVSNAEQLFDATHDVDTFLNKLNYTIDNAKVKNWVDVESFIEFLVTNDKDLSTRFYPDTDNYISPLFANPSLYKEYFAGIERFCNLFKEYLCTVLDSAFVKFSSRILTSNIKTIENFKGGFESPYSESLLNRSHGFIEFSKILNINELINYNYTYTAEAYLYLIHLYDNYNHTYHVNGELDYDSHYNIHEDNANSNHLVFGFLNTKSQELKSTFHTFEKKVLRVIKNTTPLNLKKITSRPFNLLIFGHSCGVADGDVIGELLKSQNLKIAVVLCYDQDSLVSITNNIIEIVEQGRFDELLNNANQKSGNESLYFAVRDEFKSSLRKD